MVILLIIKTNTIDVFDMTKGFSRYPTNFKKHSKPFNICVSVIKFVI